MRRVVVEHRYFCPSRALCSAAYTVTLDRLHWTWASSSCCAVTGAVVRVHILPFPSLPSVIHQAAYNRTPMWSTVQDPEGSAWPWSRLVFGWLSPLLTFGHCNTIEVRVLHRGWGEGGRQISLPIHYATRFALSGGGLLESAKAIKGGGELPTVRPRVVPGEGDGSSGGPEALAPEGLVARVYLGFLPLGATAYRTEPVPALYALHSRTAHPVHW